MTVSAPRWDLTNVYPSLESKEFKAAVEDYKKQVAALEKFFAQKVSRAGAKTPVKDLAALIGKMIERMNAIQTLSATIVPFIHSYVSTNSRDKLAVDSPLHIPRNSRITCAGRRCLFANAVPEYTV